MAVKHANDENKTQVIQKKITESNGDQKKLFNIVNTLLGRRKQLVLHDYNNPITLVSTYNMFFIDKITNIRAEFPLLESSLPPYSFESMDSIMPYCTVLLERFTMITSVELIKIISVMNKTTCCCCLPTPMTLASGGVQCSRLWSTSQLLRPSCQQCSHSVGVCPQIQG